MFTLVYKYEVIGLFCKRALQKSPAKEPEQQRCIVSRCSHLCTNMSTVCTYMSRVWVYDIDTYSILIHTPYRYEVCIDMVDLYSTHMYKYESTISIHTPYQYILRIDMEYVLIWSMYRYRRLIPIHMSRVWVYHMNTYSISIWSMYWYGVRIDIVDSYPYIWVEYESTISTNMGRVCILIHVDIVDSYSTHICIYRLLYRALLQKRPTILGSLLIEATP